MFRWILFFLICFPALGESPLKPVKLDNPRSTFKSYLAAMADYKRGLEEKDNQLKERLQDAVRCFDLGQINPTIRRQRGEKIAKLLKEVLDRVIIVDLNKIPDSPELNRWRLKDTEVTLIKQLEGERIDQFLFSQDTVDRMENFYLRVKHLPYLPDSGQGVNYTEDFTHLPTWAQEELLWLKTWQWLGIFVAILLGLILKRLSEFIIRLFKSWTETRENSVRHQTILALEKPIGLIVATLVWLLAIYALRFEGTLQAILLSLIKVVFSFNIIWAAYRLSDVVTELVRAMTAKTESVLDDQLVPLLNKTLRVFIVVTGVLLTIQNLGYNVMSILAGLGLGGLAFALAAKDTAANLFGSIMILIDRPFQVGDWVKSSGVEGTVEEIGFRSTRIRTFYNSLISVPNSALANENIDNLGRREYRRVKINLGLTYDTPPEKMEAFLEGLKNIIRANEYTRKDQFHIVFNNYGPSSLDILVYFFLRVPDWAQELVQRQNIFLEFLRLAKELNVNFAFPTQSLHVESLPDKPLQPTAVNEEELKAIPKEFSSSGKLSRPQGSGFFTPPSQD